MAGEAGTTNNAGGAGGAGAPAAGTDGGNAGRAPTHGMQAGELPAFVDDPALGGQEDIILDTLFGGPQKSDNKSSGSGDGGDTSGQSGGGSTAGSSAPAQGSPAAQGSGETRQELPAFSGAGTQGQQPGGGQQQQSPGVQGHQPSAPASPQPGQAQTSAANELAELKLRLQTLEAANIALRQAATQGAGTQPGAQQPGQGQQGQGQQPDLMQQTMALAVPPDVLAAIDNDDPNIRSAGMSHLVSATATAVYQRTMQAVDQLLTQRLSQFEGNLGAQQSQREMERQYFQAFPAHDNPLFHSLIASESQALFASMPGLAWGDQARNALGARVNDKLKALGFDVTGMGAPANGGQPPANGQGQQPQPGTPAEAGPVATHGAVVSGASGEATTTGRPAAMMGTGTRPAKEDGAGSFIASTLG